MTPTDKRKLSILVVEDHQDTLNLYRQLLESDGHSVSAVESFGGALALADQHRFDVLIADVTLPDGSGWALLERLRALMPALRASRSPAMPSPGISTAASGPGSVFTSPSQSSSSNCGMLFVGVLRPRRTTSAPVFVSPDWICANLRSFARI